MNIVLTGFMGTGKSAVGRHLAAELHVPFVDVDSAIAKKAGQSINDLFATQGEEVFRKLETEVLGDLAKLEKTVISTGGGALLEPRNRDVLQKNGILVCLTAKVGTVLERLKDDMTRPLLSGENLEQRVERLMNERQSIYDLCPIQVDTSGKTIAQVAEEIIQRVSPQWQA
jgi:shikimate kinase